MKRLLRGVIDFGTGLPDADLSGRLKANHAKLAEAIKHGLQWERPEDPSIYKVVRAHFEEHGDAPHESLIREAYPDETEIHGRLEVIGAAEFYVAGNYGTICETLKGQSKNYQLIGALRATEEIVGKGIEREGKKLQGFTEALAYVSEQLAHLGGLGKKETAASFADIFATWKTSGPLVHEPTGLERLDELTGGGPVYGSRWYILGAPDAGKTLLLAQLAHIWALRGLAVGILAVDEEKDDLTTRFAQRAGFTRTECEARDPEVVSRMADMLGPLGIRMYPPDTTIEEAAADLTTFAKARGVRAVLLIDSIQMVTCKATQSASKEPSLREVITSNVKAVRAVSSEHGMLVISTSEMNRGAYRSIEAVESSNDMAAGKESGAIEYSARVMISLRTVKDEPGLIAVRMVKNKHGASHPGVEDFYWRVDRQAQSLSTADAPEKDETSKLDDKFIKQSATVLQTIMDNPGEGQNDLRVTLKSQQAHIGNETLAAILKHLVKTNRVEERPETHGKKTYPKYYARPGAEMPAAHPHAANSNGMSVHDMDALLENV